MKKDLRDISRRLRRDQTDAEQILWYHLRGSRLKGFKFRRQHRIAGFITDFACPAQGLVVEVDGGQHAKMREQDKRRTDALSRHGYRVVRFWDNEVLQETERVLEAILELLEGDRKYFLSPTGGED